MADDDGSARTIVRVDRIRGPAARAEPRAAVRVELTDGVSCFSTDPVPLCAGRGVNFLLKNNEFVFPGHPAVTLTVRGPAGEALGKAVLRDPGAYGTAYCSGSVARFDLDSAVRMHALSERVGEARDALLGTIADIGADVRSRVWGPP